MPKRQGSRSRQHVNELPLFIFFRNTTDVDNHLTDAWNSIGHSIMAEDLGQKTREEKDVLSGRVLQSWTVQVYKTFNQIDLRIGDNVSEIPNCNEFQQATVQRIKSKPQNKRGDKHNTKRVIETIFEVS